MKAELLPSDPMPELHRACNAYPPMSSDEFEKLKANIRVHGQAVTCIMYGSKILDGRNRWLACKELCRTVKVERFQGSEEEAVALAVSLNGERRNMNKEQLSVTAADLEVVYADIVAKNKSKKCAEAGRDGAQISKKHNDSTGTGGLRVRAKLPEPLGHEVGKRARDMAAEAVKGASPRYISEIKRMRKEGHTDLVDALKSGTMKMREAKDEEARRESPAEPVLQNQTEEFSTVDIMVPDSTEPEPVKENKQRKADKQIIKTVDANVLLGARIAWNSITLQKRRMLLVALKKIPSALLPSFWIWAEEETDSC